MAHIVKKVSTTWSTEDAFAYMSDFSHAAEWDPSVVAAKRNGDTEIGLGSTFDLTVAIWRRQFTLRYEVVEFTQGRITFRALSDTLASVDTVTVTPEAGTTAVRYEARLHFRGFLQVAEPLLALGFRRIANQAIRGLEWRLSRPARA